MFHLFIYIKLIFEDYDFFDKNYDSMSLRYSVISLKTSEYIEEQLSMNFSDCYIDNRKSVEIGCNPTSSSNYIVQGSGFVKTVEIVLYFSKLKEDLRGLYRISPADFFMHLNRICRYSLKDILI